MSTEHDHRHAPAHRAEHPEILIDHHPYRASDDEMTGTQLRLLPQPPIGEDQDLWLEVPHGHDERIGDDQLVCLEPGMRFFTAPRHINPGACRP